MEIGITTRSLGPRGLSFVDRIRKAQDLGFRELELSGMPAGIDRGQAGLALARARMRCAGLLLGGKGHEGEGVADRFLSRSEEHRAAAVDRVVGIVRVARVLGAQGWIVPASRIGGLDVEVPDDEELARRFERGEHEDVVRRVQEAWAARRDAMLDALCRALHRLTRAAPEARFLLETRRGPGEFPDLEGLVSVFEEVRSPRLGYWHDTAHACRLENLGLEGQEDWMDRLGSRLAGVRLRDTYGLDDERPPGSGEVDYRLVRDGMVSTTRAVVDLAGGVGEGKRRAAMLYLEKFGWRPGRR